MLKYLLYQLEFRRYLFLALLLAVVLHLLPTPDGLSREGQAVLAILLMTVLLVILEPVALPVIAFLIVVLEVLFRVGGPAAVAQSFMSDSVIFIAGSLMLALAIVKQQLDKRILLVILRLSRASVARTTFAMLGLTGLMASFMGEHAVAATMLPVAVILVRTSQSEQVPSESLRALYLLSVAFGSLVAAVATPSGGARNAIMIGYWESMAALEVGYLDWMILMFPLVLVELPILYLLITRMYGVGHIELAETYRSMSEEIERQKRLRVEDWVTIIIVVITVLLWIFFSKSLGFGPIALIGVLLCVTGGVLNWEDISSRLNWGIIILYASIISLGLWMDQTGAADWIANGLQSLLGSLNIHGGLPLILAICILGMLGGSVLSTGPAIAILGPIVVKQAQISGFSPIVLGLVLVASSSYANFTPVSSPACTIVHGSGLVRQEELFRLGLRLALVSLLVIVLFAMFYWPSVLWLI